MIGAHVQIDKLNKCKLDSFVGMHQLCDIRFKPNRVVSSRAALLARSHLLYQLESLFHSLQYGIFFCFTQPMTKFLEELVRMPTENLQSIK